MNITIDLGLEALKRIIMPMGSDEAPPRREYRADVTIVRSPEEGNLYWGHGLGQEFQAGKPVGREDHIMCELQPTCEEAMACCEQIAHKIARTIRLTGKTADFAVGPLFVRIQLGSYDTYRENLAVHVAITEQGRPCCIPRWVTESMLEQAVDEWSDEPDIRSPLYAAIVQHIAALEKTA